MATPPVASGTRRPPQSWIVLLTLYSITSLVETFEVRQGYVSRCFVERSNSVTPCALAARRIASTSSSGLLNMIGSPPMPPSWWAGFGLNPTSPMNQAWRGLT
jgi:hypothetical protein